MHLFDFAIECYFFLFPSRINVFLRYRRFLRWGMFCLIRGLGRCKNTISINTVKPNKTVCYLHLQSSVSHWSLPPIVDGSLLAWTKCPHSYLGFGYSSCKQKSHPNQSPRFFSQGVLPVISFFICSEGSVLTTSTFWFLLCDQNILGFCFLFPQHYSFRLKVPHWSPSWSKKFLASMHLSLFAVACVKIHDSVSYNRIRSTMQWAYTVVLGVIPTGWNGTDLLNR